MTTAKHIEVARYHLAEGNIEAYKVYMRTMLRRARSQRVTNRLLAALKQDGVEV